VTRKVRETSRKAYAELLSELSDRQKKVLRALFKYEKEYGQSPTYRELKQYMLEEGFLDNMGQQIQPRLTDELPEKGFVQEDDQRQCSVTGKTVITWTYTSQAVEQLQDEGKDALETGPKQHDGVKKLG